MIEKLALQLTSFICTENYNNPKDRAKIQYGLNVFLSEGFKLIFIICLFNIIHYQHHFYLSLLILITIRVFAGGVHIKGTLNCLVLTALLFIFTSVLAPLLPRFHNVFYLFITILSLVLLIIRAPHCSIVRPIKSNKKKLQYKITAILMTVLWSIGLLYLDNAAYINCGFATILLQNMQLALVKSMNS